EWADEGGGGLAIGESDHCRNRLNAHLGRNRGMLIDIHLDELDLALRSLDGLLQNRRELLARPTPGRPKIDQDWLALGFLDDVFHKGLRRRVLDQRFRSRRSRSLQHVVFRPNFWFRPTRPRSPRDINDPFG